MYICNGDDDSASSSSSPNILDEQMMFVDSISSNNTERKIWPIPLKCWTRGGKRPTLHQLMNSSVFLEHEPSELPAETRTISQYSALPHDHDANENIDVNNEEHEFPHSSFDEYVRENIRNLEKLHVDRKKKLKSNSKVIAHKVKKESSHYNAVNSAESEHFPVKQKKATPQKTFHSSNYNSRCEPSSYKTSNKKKNYTITPYQHGIGISDWNWNDASYKLNSFEDFPTLSGEAKTRKVEQRESNPPVLNFSLASKELLQSCDASNELSNKFMIENLPLDVTKISLEEFLEGFGHVVQLKLQKVENCFTAAVSMSPDSDCEWIVQCLNGTHAFGESSQPLQCYLVRKDQEF